MRLAIEETLQAASKKNWRKEWLPVLLEVTSIDFWSFAGLLKIGLHLKSSTFILSLLIQPEPGRSSAEQFCEQIGEEC